MNCVSQAARDAVGQQEVEVFLLRTRWRSGLRTVIKLSTCAGSASRRWIRAYTTSPSTRSAQRALAASLVKLKTRLELSQGQAPVAAPGTARMARRDRRAGAVLRIRRGALLPRRRRAATRSPQRRRAGFMRLAELYRERFAETARLTAEVDGRHLRPAVHRRLPRAVPVQPLRARAPAGRRVRAVVVGRDGHRSRRQPLLRPDRLVRRQRVRLRLLQGVHRARRRSARASSARCSAPITRWSPTTSRRLREISGLDEVSFHMSGTEAVMQAVRLARYHTRRTHLVRFCGAYHGWWGDVQPGVGNPVAGARDLHAEGHVRGRAARAAHAPRHRLRAGQPAAGAAPERQRARRFGAGRQRSRGAHFDRAAYADWLQRLREVCTERGIVLIFDEVFVGFRLAPRRRAGILRRARRHGHLRQDAGRRPAGRRAVRPHAT